MKETNIKYETTSIWDIAIQLEEPHKICWQAAEFAHHWMILLNIFQTVLSKQGVSLYLS